MLVKSLRVWRIRSIFGDTAPFIGVWLVMQTGSKIAPATYMAAISIAVLLVVLFMPETSKRSLVHEEDIRQA